MLARLHVLLPFEIAIPEGEQLSTVEIDCLEQACKVCILPPHQSYVPRVQDDDKILIDDKASVLTNVLCLDFYKEDFDRQKGIDCDPPVDFISHIINSFLERLRFVTRTNCIHPINFLSVTWRLRYLNNDKTELETAQGLVRGRSSLHAVFKYPVLDKEVWSSLHKLPLDFTPPQWISLLLDAGDILPEIGPAIVLAETALEVFISTILEELSKSSTIPKDIWIWLNERDWFRKPTVEERFDILLKELAGISLKENERLWVAFKNLKTARNTFAHAGVAKIGNQAISVEKAKELLILAQEIILWIKEELPSTLQWQEYEHSFEMTIRKKLLQVKQNDENA